MNLLKAFGLTFVFLAIFGLGLVSIYMMYIVGIGLAIILITSLFYFGFKALGTKS